MGAENTSEQATYWMRTLLPRGKATPGLQRLPSSRVTMGGWRWVCGIKEQAVRFVLSDFGCANVVCNGGIHPVRRLRCTEFQL